MKRHLAILLLATSVNVNAETYRDVAYVASTCKMAGESGMRNWINDHKPLSQRRVGEESLRLLHLNLPEERFYIINLSMNTVIRAPTADDAFMQAYGFCMDKIGPK